MSKLHIFFAPPEKTEADPQFTRAMELQKMLETRCEGSEHFDMLGRYRMWLDAEGIHAETNGWPSEEAYAEENIAAFAADWKAAQEE